MNNNLTALITGGASGIGLESTKRFLQEGFKVVVFDSAQDAEEKLKIKLKSITKNLLIVSVDVTNYQSIIDGFGKIKKADLKHNVLVNSAGISPPTNALHEYSIDDWNRCIDINLTGTFMVTKEFISYFLDTKVDHGSIINISSIMGVTASAAQAVYSATKHGVVGFTKSVAQDYAHKNLRVNAIGPGVIETPMTEGVLNDDNVMNALLSRIPLKRVAKASEVANLIYFLASDEASYITGAYIPIDGGYLSS